MQITKKNIKRDIQKLLKDVQLFILGFDEDSQEEVKEKPYLAPALRWRLEIIQGKMKNFDPNSWDQDTLNNLSVIQSLV